MSGDRRQFVDLSADEVEALMIGAHWVAGHADPAMRRAAVRAMARLVQALPPDQAEAMRSATLFVGARDDDDGDDVDDGWGHDYGEEPDPAPLCQAIRDGRRLSLVYRDLADERSERIIWPFAMAQYGRRDVLLGWCELRGDYRTFRIDRIVVARVLADHYPRSRETLLREWQERSDIAHDQFVLSKADARAA